MSDDPHPDAVAGLRAEFDCDGHMIDLEMTMLIGISAMVAASLRTLADEIDAMSHGHVH